MPAGTVPQRETFSSCPLALPHVVQVRVAAEIRPEFLFHLFLQACGADDADVGYPVADDGDDFERAGVFAGEQEAAVFEFAYGFLVGQQGAAFEVGGGFGVGADDDFAEVAAVVEAVGFVDAAGGVLVGQEGFGLLFEVFDLGEAVGFLFALVEADEVPDAVFVEQAVGFDAVAFALAAACFGVVEAEDVALGDGLGDEVEFGGFVADVFVLEAFYGDALGEFFLEKAAVGFGEEFLDAGEAADAGDVVLAEVAVSVAVEGVVAAFGVVEQVAEAADVALDGAQGDAVFGGEGVGVEGFAVVEAGEDAGEAVAEFFSVFAGMCHVWFRCVWNGGSVSAGCDIFCRAKPRYLP